MNPITHFKTYLADEEGTKALGAAFAHTLASGLTCYLHGDLGTGKTTLTRAILHAAGHTGHVKSPTYTLAEPYTINLNGQAVQFFHFDLYRITNPEEFLEAGFREYFNDNSICIIEWPENAATVLPPADIHVYLNVAGSGREVKLDALSEKGSHCLSQLKFASAL